MKTITLLINDDEVEMKTKDEVNLYDLLLAILMLTDVGMEAEPNFKKNLISALKKT